MKAIIVWALIANYHPVDHPRYLEQFASKAVCEQKIEQRESDKIN